MEIRDLIGLGVSGILTFLWWDIRGIRQNKEGFLKKETHALLCENTVLRIEKKIDDMRDKIIQEIKNNHG